MAVEQRLLAAPRRAVHKPDRVAERLSDASLWSWKWLGELAGSCAGQQAAAVLLLRDATAQRSVACRARKLKRGEGREPWSAE